jgi:hypothetical protein
MGRLSHKVGVCIAVLAAACSLDVEGTGTPPSAPLVDASTSDGAKPKEASSEASPTADATGATDARREASTDAAPPCDLDHDGHASKACGGDDCCDNDARTQPGASDFQDSADACGKFDYNCDGKEEHEFGKSTVCDQPIVCADPGFVTDTTCGVNAAFKNCDWILGCRPSDAMRTQRCR